MTRARGSVSLNVLRSLKAQEIGCKSPRAAPAHETPKKKRNNAGLVAGGGIGEGAGDEHGVEEAVAIGDVLKGLVTREGTGIDRAGAVKRGAIGSDGLGPVGNIGELIVEETERVVIGVKFWRRHRHR